MSFKTEYHVDVSFLHDLVTMGHTAKEPNANAPSGNATSAKASIAKAQSANAQSANAKKSNKNEEKWARKRALSRQTKEKRQQARHAWIANTDKLENYKHDGPLDELMIEELFEAAQNCDLSSSVDDFKNMWKNLTYGNKKMMQAYFNKMNAVYSDSKEKTQNTIPLAVLNFINDDVFETLLKCIVTNFNSKEKDIGYLKKVEELAISPIFKNRDAFKRIWEKLNFDAQYYLLNYFSIRTYCQEQAKICKELKKEEENRKKSEYERNQKQASGNLNFQNYIGDDGLEHL